jgi:hypothetical protein
MLDEMQRLSESESMRRLLDHYATKGIDDRMTWQDRLMELESVTAGELTRLHGELLAAEWVEMNVGFTSGKCPGGVAACYRITVAGLRAWKRTQGGFYLEDDEEEVKPALERSRRAQRGNRAKKETSQSTQEPVLPEATNVTMENLSDEGGESQGTTADTTALSG